jgi:hypothetical protein
LGYWLWVASMAVIAIGSGFALLGLVRDTKVGKA